MIKTSDKNKRQKQATKTLKNMDKIRSYLRENGTSKTKQIAEYLELSPARTRAIIALMDDIESSGGNNDRTYHLKEEQNR